MLRCLPHFASSQCCRSHTCMSAGYRGSVVAAQASPLRCVSLMANHRGWVPASGTSLLGSRRPYRSERRSGRRQVSTQALFGVGAPEAVLVGVVALVVFGPKGLAEAVKSLGKTLKTFQPTIREVMSVSSELRSTLEEQIGLDDIRSELQSSMVSEPRPAARRPADSAEYRTTQDGVRQDVSDVEQLVEESEADLERKRSVAAAAAWGGQPPSPPADIQSVPKVEARSTHSGGELEKQVQLGALSLEDLEAELSRRRDVAGQKKS